MQVSEELYQQVAEFIEHEILHRFKASESREKLVMTGVIVIESSEWIIECTGDYEVKDGDFTDDETPVYTVNCWLLEVTISHPHKQETVRLDADKIEQIINQ